MYKLGAQFLEENFSLLGQISIITSTAINITNTITCITCVTPLKLIITDHVTSSQLDHAKHVT